MKKMLILLLALCLLVPSALAQEQRLDAAALEARMHANPYLNLFDLRAEADFDQGHLPGAVSFPLPALRQELQQILDKGFSYMDAEIVLYGASMDDCRAGEEIIAELGFTNIWLFGSVSDWPGSLVSSAQEQAQQAQLLANLDTVDLDGNRIDGSLLAGHRLTMVNIWATYCSPCISELPELARLSRDMESQGVQVVGIPSDCVDNSFAPAPMLVAYAKELLGGAGADYPQLLPNVDMYMKFLASVNSVPTTFFVDETGTLVGQVYIGSRDYDAWAAIIQETLALVP